MNNSEVSGSEVPPLWLFLLLLLDVSPHLEAITESSASTEGTEMKCPFSSLEFHVFNQSLRAFRRTCPQSMRGRPWMLGAGTVKYLCSVVQHQKHQS